MKHLAIFFELRFEARYVGKRNAAAHYIWVWENSKILLDNQSHLGKF